MKFYGQPGERVWDDELARRVALFDRYGQLETDNDYVIAELLRRGYRSDKPEEPIEGEAAIKTLFDAVTGQDGKVSRKRKAE